MIILDYMTLIRIQTSDWNSCMLVFVCVCCLPEALGVHAHQIYQVCQPHPGRRAGRDIVVSICQALNIWKRLNVKPNWQKLLTSLPGFPGGPDGPRGPRGPYSKTIVINWFNWPSKAVAMFFWMCHLCGPCNMWVLYVCVRRQGLGHSQPGRVHQPLHGCLGNLVGPGRETNDSESLEFWVCVGGWGANC